MEFLIPLYLAGLSALTLPLLFHLVRRTPRHRQEFSSLMFLSATIPRMTRRSRLDQILLLLLRLAALAWIAFAFSRPFFREANLLSLADLAGKRVVILIDVSASMRRGDLWQQALKLAEQEIDQLNPQDDVGIYTFGSRVRAILEPAKSNEPLIPDKKQVARNRLKQISPTWEATDLGTALVTIAGDLEVESDTQQSVLEPQIVVISDLQSGSNIDAVRSYEWPKRVSVMTHRVSLEKTTNASVQVLPQQDGDEITDYRVRVVNSSDSKSDQFYVGWGEERTTGPATTPSSQVGRKDSFVAVYVPAGQSRVIKLKRTADSLTADRFVLRGDDQDFDNTFYIVPPVKQAIKVLYIGSEEANRPQGLRYFWQLAVENDPLKDVTTLFPQDQNSLFIPGDTPPEIVVLTRSISPEWTKSLLTYVEQGGLVLFVPENPASTELFGRVLEDVDLVPSQSAPNGSKSQYLLLGQIDFTHPLFAPFASPRYSDFTKIHFWQHTKVELKGNSKSRVIARFDNGDPALLEQLRGKGRIIGFTSGWAPNESQLALSSKFVPLVAAIIDIASGGAEVVAQMRIGDSIALPILPTNKSPQIQLPGGEVIQPESGSQTFSATDRPGIYIARTTPKATRFAVNLSALESQTSPLELEKLEQFGVRMGAVVTRAEMVERLRQQRDTELESRQKIWRWMLVLAILALILETFLAGRANRQLLSGAPNVPQST